VNTLEIKGFVGRLHWYTRSLFLVRTFYRLAQGVRLSSDWLLLKVENNDTTPQAFQTLN
jgi:hypothetical protein